MELLNIQNRLQDIQPETIHPGKQHEKVFHQHLMCFPKYLLTFLLYFCLIFPILDYNHLRH